ILFCRLCRLCRLKLVKLRITRDSYGNKLKSILPIGNMLIHWTDMSTYTQLTKHPNTGKWEEAVWQDDYFAPHRYGVRFKDGTTVEPTWKDGKLTPETKGISETQVLPEEPDEVSTADLSTS